MLKTLPKAKPFAQSLRPLTIKRKALPAVSNTAVLAIETKSSLRSGAIGVVRPALVGHLTYLAIDRVPTSENSQDDENGTENPSCSQPFIEIVPDS